MRLAAGVYFQPLMAALKGMTAPVMTGYRGRAALKLVSSLGVDVKPLRLVGEAACVSQTDGDVSPSPGLSWSVLV